MNIRNLIAFLFPTFYAMADDGGGSEDTIGTGNDARVALLERINDANDATRAEELMDVNEDGTITQFVAQELTEEEQAAKEAELQQDPDGALKETLDRAVEEGGETPEPVKFKIKVNGKEMELTQDELIARAQKVEAADQYLVEAKRLQREAQEGSRAPETQQEDAEAIRFEEKRALVRAIQMGTEDEAMAALDKLQTLNRPTIDENSIARTIDERLTFKEAANRFATEYNDVMSDPMLKKMALEKDMELVKQGDRRDYWQRFQEVGNEIRSWRDNLVKSSQPKESRPDASLTLDQKQQRKAAAPQTPKSASVKAGRAVDENDEDKEESVGSVIAEMAKARGGSQRLRT
jgi:hypothetical protein